MTEKFTQRKGKLERSSRWLRNFNALGAIAMGGAAVLAPPVAGAALGTLAAINAAQAGGFEWARRRAKKSHAHKSG